MDGFPSGQRGQTVNLLAVLSVVRIHLPPPRSAVVHDTMGYRTFYFSVEEVLISSIFPSMGVQKSLMLGFSYFTEGALLIFALHPLMRKNQIVDRFIKRLQRKIKLFLDIYLLRFSSSPRESQCSCWFWYNRKSLLRGQNRRKKHKTRAFEVKCWLRKPLFALFSCGFLPFQSLTAP